jgi:hypothetical protein
MQNGDFCWWFCVVVTGLKIVVCDGLWWLIKMEWCSCYWLLLLFLSAGSRVGQIGSIESLRPVSFGLHRSISIYVFWPSGAQSDRPYQFLKFWRAGNKCGIRCSNIVPTWNIMDTV